MALIGFSALMFVPPALEVFQKIKKLPTQRFNPSLFH